MIRVLFVDDDPMFITILQGCFLGPLFSFAHNAEEARSLLRELGPFDIMITDYQMLPEDGLSLASFVHTTYPKIKIFIMSSLKPKLPDYIHNFIEKPINLHYLKNLLMENS